MRRRAAELLERRGQRVRQRLWIADQPAVDEEADRHLAAVAEDADAHAEAARARRPDEHALQRRAGQRQRLARAGHVRDHHRRLRGEEVDEPRLDRGRRRAHRGEDAVRDRPLVGVLDRRGAPAHLEQAVDRRLDPDREAEQQEPEAVAELARDRVLQRAQVERHHRVDLVEDVAARAQVLAEHAGHGAQQDVVDRRPERAAQIVDVVQRQRRRPAHPLADAEVAAQGAGPVGRVGRELRQDPGVLDAGAGDLLEVARVRDGVDRLVHRGPARAASEGDEVADGPRDDRAVRRRLDAEGVGRAVDERQHDAGEHDAVGDRVVHPDEHRAAAPGSRR